MLLNTPLDLIGNTPMVEIHSFETHPRVRIFAKLEGQNPTGSIKDRIARALVGEMEARGELEPGDTLVEASSGNTAIALALVARQRGYQLEVALPRGVAPSIEDVLSVYDTRIHWAPPVAGMKGAIDLAEELGATRGLKPVRQFLSRTNIETHYQTTGPEILGDIGAIDSFVGGIGTGGTLMGTGRRLREANAATRLVGIEPVLGDRLQGLRSLEEGYRPPLLDLDVLSRRMLVGAARSFELANEVASREGLIVGVSSGATLHGALAEAKWWADRIERGEAPDQEDFKIVAMFCDSGWKYLPARPWQAAHEQDADLDDIHWW